MLRNRTFGGGLVLALMAAISGCNNKTEFKTQDPGKTVKAAKVHHHGSHGGHVADLGPDHKLLAEITYTKEPRAITVYVIDHNDPKKDVALAAEKMELELHDDKGGHQSVTLTADPQEGDAMGQSSRFVAKGKEIPESIHDLEDIEGHLKVTIGEETLEAEFGHHDEDEDEDHHANDDDDNKKE